MAASVMAPTDVSHLLRQLHDIDPNGDGVRYDFDSKGNPTMLQVRRVDLEHAERNMRGISEFLIWAHSEVGSVMGILPSEAEIALARRYAESSEAARDAKER